MKKNITSSAILTTISMLIIIFSGCGSSNDPFAIHNISGTVAIGEGVPANITIVGSKGKSISGTSNSNGSYTLNAVELTPPLMIKAVLVQNGVTLYSYVPGDGTTANVTPLTSYLIDQAAVSSGDGGGAGQLFSHFRRARIPAGVSANVQQHLSTLNADIAVLLSANNAGGFNHFSDRFEANHANYDAALDALDIEIFEDDIIIRVNGNVLNTLNYAINVANINLSGNVFDISNDTNVSNATITMTDSNGTTLSTTTNANGVFSLSVSTMRVYDVNVSAAGYDTKTIPYVGSFSLTDSSMGAIALFPTVADATTNLSGSVIDARTQNTGIPNVTMKFRSGFGERISAPVATTTSNSDGNFSTPVSEGSYTVEISQSDFYTLYANVDIYGANQTLDFSLLRNFTGSTDYFATIVLNWDEKPHDLDSHLTGAAIAGTPNRFHLYYATPHRVVGSTSTNLCTDGMVASLDRDRIGFGGGLLPETITICDVPDAGIYKYYIHHFSGDATMAVGNAEVTVATISGVSRSFLAPSTATGNNDIWHVFNLDADGNIYPINQIIGQDNASSALFQAPAFNRGNFSADENLFISLPAK